MKFYYPTDGSVAVKRGICLLTLTALLLNGVVWVQPTLTGFIQPGMRAARRAAPIGQRGEEVWLCVRKPMKKELVEEKGGWLIGCFGGITFIEWLYGNTWGFHLAPVSGALSLDCLRTFSLFLTSSKETPESWLKTRVKCFLYEVA